MADSWGDSLRRLADEFVDVVVWGGEIDDDSYEQIRLRRSVGELRREFETASTSGSLDEVIVVVTGVLRHGGEALLDWLDLVEEIVQVAEQRFGTREGRGEFKAEQAKAAVRRLLQRSDARSAIFVDLVGPSAVDVFTGWFIDVT